MDAGSLGSQEMQWTAASSAVTQQAHKEGVQLSPQLLAEYRCSWRRQRHPQLAHISCDLADGTPSACVQHAPDRSLCTCVRATGGCRAQSSGQWPADRRPSSRRFATCWPRLTLSAR
eukprot:365001-Chlamydomonas_euryale.AAC.17